MKPILLFFPGAGPLGPVAERLGGLFPEVEVVGITYPQWRDLTDPAQAMDHVLADVERQVRARANSGPVLILGYSLGADRLGLCPRFPAGRRDGRVFRCDQRAGCRR